MDIGHAAVILSIMDGRFMFGLLHLYVEIQDKWISGCHFGEEDVDTNLTCFLQK